MAETLGSRFVRQAKRRWPALCIADSTGRELTFGRTLVAALLLSRAIGRLVPARAPIGLLLPASVGGALANIAATFAGAVPVNLNFTAGHDAMAAAIERCGIETILTSRAFVKKAGIETLRGMIFLEDVLARTRAPARAAMLAAARLLPAPAIERLFLAPTSPDALATIIFSSGSTGVPKGVMLTHANLVSNIDAANRVFRLQPDDVMLGVLPFFHSFGFTATLWLPLCIGCAAAYHANPIDAKTIGELAAAYRATILISTPTFCAAYVRKIQRAQFAHLRLAIVGAERLRDPIALQFKERFGVDLLEGYGCTEMAPVVAVNVPDESESARRPAAGAPRGSVGRPLPGIDAKIVDLESGDGPLVGREGLLLVRGPNRMAGYLGDPDSTRAAVRDGWYLTGDVAMIDADGFIHITDRLSRFSKIAGEMVPHLKVEEELQALLAEPSTCVVTAIEDPVKGERLIAFHTDPNATPQALCDRLNESSLPKLWIPKREDLRFVESIPTLGTGKVDLRAVRQLASDAPKTPWQP